MKKSTLFIQAILSFNFLIWNLYGGTVIISGEAPSHKGDKISFYSHIEEFAYTKKELCTFIVDTGGYFECSFDIDQTLKVFADLGIFRVHLYTEPGKKYKIVFPIKKEKEMKDKLNPYFKPVELHCGIENLEKDDLNTLIKMFNDAYIPFYNKHVVDIALNRDFQKLNEDIDKFTEPFHIYDNQYFHDYIKYKLGLLRFLAQQNKSKRISKEFFVGMNIGYGNPAYMELFNQIYDSYFELFGRTNEGKKIYEDINRDKSYEKLTHTLERDSAIADKRIMELVILKNINDEFYSNRFSRSALLQILESLIASTEIDTHKIIGENIKKKITLLLSGHFPPDFELYDQDSNLVKLSDLKGSYVYLNFCASHSYSCIQEYEALKYLYEKHHERIDIITISTDVSYSAMVKARKQMKCPWTFLYYDNQPDVLEKYDIRAFPTYFLIDKEGKLSRSPAPSPGENIEQTLFEVMRANGDI